MTIRPLQSEDIDAAAIVHDASWRSAYAGIVPETVFAKYSIEARRRRFQQRFDDHSDETIVAEVQTRVVGFASFGRSRDADDRDRAVGEIYGIYLHPDHWRKGMGRAMLDWVRAELRSREYRELTLWVLERNQPAQRFYEALGLRPDGARKEITIGIPLIELRYRVAL